MPPPAPGADGAPVADRWASDPRFHPRRWMMLPEGHGLHPGHPAVHGYIRFLNPDTGTMIRAQIPLFSDHCAIDSVDGLILLLLEEDSTVRLLHPFTGDVAELPPLANLLPQLAPLFYNCPVPQRIRRLAGIVSASASFSSEAITVMLALHEVFQIDPPVRRDGVDSGCVLHPPKLIATVPEGNLITPTYMVECDSEILLLGHKDFYMSQIVVYKLSDLVLQRCVPIKSIGGNTLFISGRSLSVASKALSTPMGDNVICFDPAEHSLVQYHLISGTWSPAIDNCSVIYSCCVRNRWNSGLAFGRNIEGWFGDV